MAEVQIKNHPGYVGCFTDGEWPGALKNGTRIVKSRSEPGDATSVGTPGTVLGSIHAPENGYLYFVEWDDKPKMAIGVHESKIKAVG